MTQILIVTVGGSHQPIVSAINELQPDFVVFICTDKDPATGRAGSVSQIDGKGSCIKAHPADDKPTLPNIPTQSGLTADAVSELFEDNRKFAADMGWPDAPSYQYVLTSADDLDRIYLDCKQALDKIRQRFPGAKIFADYTGGTKSMSAGLVMAALEYPEVQLQIVTGSRADLIKVQDGSQFTAEANSEQVRYQRLIAPYRQAWTRYAYSEAEAGLKNIKPPNNTELRGQYVRFRELSRAFTEWDNFNHQTAFEILQNFATKSLTLYMSGARALNDNNPAKRDAAKLFDLYRNAQRRADQGRYDDAIARIYRLIEWTAQWLLETKVGIKTGNVLPEQIPENLTLTQNREGQWQAGLFNAWQLVKLKTEGAAARFITEQEKNLLNHIKVRNGSILAHGFAPIKAADWQPIHAWLEQHFIPMLLDETFQVGIKQMPEQLPNQYH